jgi:hypothetical protein
MLIGGARAAPSRLLRLGMAAGALLALAHYSAAPARAQSLNQLTGALGSLGGGIPSVDQASPANIAGLLQYCVKNDYLSGDSATSAASSALDKMGASGQGTKDSGFMAGTSGLLQTGGDKTMALGGDGMKAEVTKEICDLVLKHAKSLL